MRRGAQVGEVVRRGDDVGRHVGRQLRREHDQGAEHDRRRAADPADQLDRIPDRRAEDHDGGAGDRHADEGEGRHRGREPQRLSQDLRPLARRVAGEVGDVEAERGPVAHAGGERRREDPPEGRARAPQPLRLREQRAEAAAHAHRPEQQQRAAEQQQRRRPALQQLDALRSAEDHPHLDQPEHGEGDARPAGNLGPAGPRGAAERVQRERADPGLDPEPAAGHDGAEQRGQVGPADAEAGPAQDREGNAVLGACVRVEHHRHQHDDVAEQDGEHRLPPVHALRASGPMPGCRW